MDSNTFLLHRSKVKLKYIRFFLLTLIANISFLSTSLSQNFSNLTVNEAISFALKNNKNIQIKELDSKFYSAQTDEVIATGLPQININSKFDDNLVIATTLLPGEVIGQKAGTYIPVKFGTPYNMNFGVDVNQLIYSHSYWTGIKASKAAQELASLSTNVSKEELAYNISVIFYSALITQKQIEILKNNIEKLKQLEDITKVSEDNGVLTQIDVDRISVSKTNTETDLQNAQTGLNQQLNMLKLFMGLESDKDIKIKSDLESSEVNNKINMDNEFLSNRNDVKLLDKQIELLNLEKDAVNAGYYPSLSANFRYYMNAMRNEFDFFSGGDWFKSSSIGISLNIPIFDGFSKSAKSQQSDIKIQKAKLQSDFMKTSISMDVQIAKEKLDNSRKSLNTIKLNMDLANSIYGQTQLKYSQGATVFSDLISAETSLKDSQNNYIKSLLNVMIAQIDLRKADGTLLSSIKEN